MSTITLNDFSIEFNITDKLWEKYSQLYPNLSSRDEILNSVKQVIRKKVKKIVKNENNSNLHLNNEIVSICFDFSRPEIIELMKERGQAIKDMDIENVKELEK